MAWVKPKSFAVHAGVSERLVRDWLKSEGLPCSRLPSGTILIEIEQGDSWLRSFGVAKDTGQTVKEILDGIV